MTDLRSQPPRQWKDKLAGYLWLPRLLDKVRAFQAGTLGTYAYPSILDRVLVRACHLSPATLEQIVRDLRTDEAIGAWVLQQTRHSTIDIEIFNQQFEGRYKPYLNLLDRDDGYAPGMGYPLPDFLQPFVWRLYQRWSRRKASAASL